MNKQKIKVVKRDAPKPEPTPVSRPEKDPNRGITNTVKDWISERRENREAESVSSERQSAKWHGAPEPSVKPA